MDRRTFRARINDHTFDITLDENGLRVNGKPVDYTLAPVSDGYFSLLVDGRSVPVVVTPLDDDRLRVTISGRSQEVHVQDEHDLLLERFGLAAARGTAEREVRAPMPGLVVDVMVAEGQSVRKGDGLLVLEAMKMENELRAPATGTVQTVHASTNEAVEKDALLIEIDAEGG